MAPCALCGRPEDVAWLGGYELGEFTVCARCYESLPLRTPRGVARGAPRRPTGMRQRRHVWRPAPVGRPQVGISKRRGPTPEPSATPETPAYSPQTLYTLYRNNSTERRTDGRNPHGWGPRMVRPGMISSLIRTSRPYARGPIIARRRGRLVQRGGSERRTSGLSGPQTGPPVRRNPARLYGRVRIPLSQTPPPNRQTRRGWFSLDPQPNPFPPGSAPPSASGWTFRRQSRLDPQPEPSPAIRPDRRRRVAEPSASGPGGPRRADLLVLLPLLALFLLVLLEAVGYV